jgi:hypothetical protein
MLSTRQVTQATATDKVVAGIFCEAVIDRAAGQMAQHEDDKVTFTGMRRAMRRAMYSTWLKHISLP